MGDDTVSVLPGTDIPDRERVLDWLTALVPLILISLIYYRLNAAALECLAVGGYLMGAVLMSRPCRRDLAELRIAPGLVVALLTAFCLPATAPWWLAALAGGVAAVWDSVPVLVAQKYPDSPFARPFIHPAVIAYLLMKGVFAGLLENATLPAQWSHLDGAATATPLLAFAGQDVPVDRWHLLFGIYAGAIGETCAVAILLAVAYLMIRRRLRLIAPAMMLLTVSVFSWIWWNSPLYSILSGGVLLAALLLADRQTAPASHGQQVTVGIVAGFVTVLLRRYAGTEGAAVGVLAAQLMTPFLPAVWKFFVWVYGVSLPVRQWIARQAVRLWTWAKPSLKKATDRLGAWGITAWKFLSHKAGQLYDKKIRPIFQKKEK